MNRKERKKLEAALLKQLEARKEEINAALAQGEKVEIVLDFGVAGRKCVGVIG